MAYWHEIRRRRGYIRKYSSDHMARQLVARSVENPDIFQAHFERGEARSMTGEGWIEMWPIEPTTAASAPEAVAKASEILEVVAGRQHDNLFEQRPRPIPLHKKRVKEVLHPTHRALAWIHQHTEKLFEVYYFGDVVGNDETGWRLGIPPFGDFQNSLNYEGRTFADSLESAEEIAAQELDLLVKNGPEPIQLR